MPMKPAAPALKPARHGVARTLSKLGIASRTVASTWVREGRVRVNGRVVLDVDFPVRQGADRIAVDGAERTAAPRLAIMLNKPRGLVTSTADELGRDTVYRCFAGAALPWLAPIGRLDKASEGLLLFSNDPVWAGDITDPVSGPPKTYHVQIDRLPDEQLLRALARGMLVDGVTLRASSASVLRVGAKNSWLEIVLGEGRNRQIRRLLSAFDVSVMRLVRVAIGSLVLGDLPKGGWRALSMEEMAALP